MIHSYQRTFCSKELGQHLCHRPPSLQNWICPASASIQICFPSFFQSRLNIGYSSRLQHVLCYQIKSSSVITYLICYMSNFDRYFRELETEHTAYVSAISAVMRSDILLHTLFLLLKQMSSL